MKKIIILLVVLIVVILLAKSYIAYQASLKKPITQTTTAHVQDQQTLPSAPVVQGNSQIAKNFQPPLDRAAERVTKKPFGIYITPKTSPVQPERFQGFHTGTDFEIFPEELNADVPVRAVCAGKLVLKKIASGYGGVAVESCDIDGQPITVMYGHLKLTSIGAKIGDNLNIGDNLGLLGKAYSSETDGERKHLHLGFHKGNSINILGYVSAKNQLTDWIDPCGYVCF